MNKMKQLKSSSRDLRDLFEYNITVKHIQENLCSRESNSDAITVREEMKKLDFDVMGIEEAGDLYGYVEQSKLIDGRCKDHVQIFRHSELVSETTPLIQLLPILHDLSRVFVLDCNQVKGIVTRGDLQKAPVRMLFFGLVTLLEMNLLRIIRLHYPNDSLQNNLSPERLKKAEDLLSQRHHRNEAIDLMDCLQFCDKRDLVLRIPEIRDHIKDKLGSFEVVFEDMKTAEELRDKLAHAQDIVSGSTWPKIIDLVGSIEKSLELFEDI